MNESERCLLPAVELMAQLDAGAVSSRVLLEAYLERVERLNPALNAIVTLDTDGARALADRADAARARGERWGPLHGLPITVKDVFETEGLRTTAGAEELANHVPSRDAVLVDRLRRAGAIIFGKTNTPAMAADGQTFNALFGTTNNPWDLARTPGGSSGGCGAAVAAGLTAMSFGSDIAGSIRIPASFCGVYGHKPTFGLVPQQGHIPGPPGQRRERDLNVVGPLARDARDLDLAMGVLAGPASQELLEWQSSLPPPPARPLSKARVAAWLDDPFCPVDTSLTERFSVLVSALRAEGATVVEEARPDVVVADAFALYERLLRPPEDLSHAEWLELDEARAAYRDRWAALFADYDVVLCPVCSTPPFPHDHRPREERAYVINGEPRPLRDYIVWPGLVGLAYLPATVPPLGTGRAGLPVGIQVVGPHLGDRRTIAFAQALSGLVGGYLPPPGL